MSTTSRTGRPLTCQHLLTLPRGIHGNEAHLTDREAGRAEQAPKLSCPPWRILVNNNTPCFACKTASVSARKPSVFAGGKDRTTGTIAENPTVPDRGAGPGTPTIPGRTRGFLPAWIFCAKPFFSGFDTTVVLFSMTRGPGGPKSWGRWQPKPHTNRAGKFRAKVSVFSRVLPGYHPGIPHTTAGVLELF